VLRSLIIPSSSTWAIDATDTVSGSFDFPLPPGANGGSVTVFTDAPTCLGGPDGTSFVVKADGVAVLTTGCIVNTSQVAIIPPGTLNVHVDVVNNCLGGGRDPATSIISGAG
jgi:hypothetical protein